MYALRAHSVIRNTGYAFPPPAPHSKTVRSNGAADPRYGFPSATGRVPSSVLTLGYLEVVRAQSRYGGIGERSSRCAPPAIAANHATAAPSSAAAPAMKA